MRVFVYFKNIAANNVGNYNSIIFYILDLGNQKDDSEIFSIFGLALGQNCCRNNKYNNDEIKFAADLSAV